MSKTYHANKSLINDSFTRIQKSHLNHMVIEGIDFAYDDENSKLYIVHGKKALLVSSVSSEKLKEHLLNKQVTRQFIKDYLSSQLSSHRLGDRVRVLYNYMYDNYFNNKIQETDLNPFTKAYIEAIMFTECHCDNPDLEDKGFNDIDEKTLSLIISDCAGFEMLNKILLDKAYKHDGYDIAQAGYDFWLTRNHHGTGFWDRGLGLTGDRLTKAAHAYKEQNVFLGDNGKIMIE